jgi:hypothetical protein
MLDPNLPILLKKLAEKGYVTSIVRNSLDSATIAFLEPPDVIAGKGLTRISYNFGRRTLSVEGSIPAETLIIFKDVSTSLMELGNDIRKALIPFEVAVSANIEAKPKFTETSHDFVKLLGNKLRLADGSFVFDGSDPNSNKWFHLALSRLWSSNITTEKGCLYRLKLTYRDSEEKVFHLLENLECILETIVKEV